MKEFIEQLKLYKEFILVIIGLVTGSIFIATYFATKDALTQAQKQLNDLIAERECQLGNRITIAEAGITLASLEREQIEKLRDKIDAQEELGKRSSAIEKKYIKEKIERIAADLTRLDVEIRTSREQRKQANDLLVRNACAGTGKK